MGHARGQRSGEKPGPQANTPPESPLDGRAVAVPEEGPSAAGGRSWSVFVWRVKNRGRWGARRGQRSGETPGPRAGTPPEAPRKPCLPPPPPPEARRTRPRSVHPPRRRSRGEPLEMTDGFPYGRRDRITGGVVDSDRGAGASRRALWASSPLLARPERKKKCPARESRGQRRASSQKERLPNRRRHYTSQTRPPRTAPNSGPRDAAATAAVLSHGLVRSGGIASRAASSHLPPASFSSRSNTQWSVTSTASRASPATSFPARS